MRRALRSPGLRLAISLAGALAVAHAAACRPASQSSGQPGGSPDAAQRPRRGGTAVVAVAAHPTQVNELLAGGAAPDQDVIQRLLFASLFEEQPATASPAADRSIAPPGFQPALAESIAWSADRLSATVRLRPGLTWSDGAPLTAEDVRWTWLAQTDPAVAWDYAFVKEDIVAVEAPHPTVAVFRFRRASLGQMADLNEGVVLPRHAWSALPFTEWRRQPEWFASHLVASGPFLPAAAGPGDAGGSFRRNERYFRAAQGLPHLDGVRLEAAPERAAQRLRMLAGAFDYAEFIPPAELPRFEESAVARPLVYPTRQVNFIVWNTRRPPFDEPAVRRALTRGIDRQALVEALYRGHARVAVTSIISTAWARDPAGAPWPHDPAAARRELEALGFAPAPGNGDSRPLARDGRPLRLELLTNSESQLRADAAALVAEQLRRIGAEASVRTVEISALMAALDAGAFDGVLLAAALDTSLDLRAEFHSASIADGTNWSRYASPETDRLLDEFQAATDPDAARLLLHRVQANLHRDQPYTWLWEPDRIDAASRRLGGARPNALSPWFRIEEWWLAADR